MKQTLIGLFLVAGAVLSLQAQDKIVLRNGKTIEVYVRSSLDNKVEYVYPGERTVYERPKSAISYILYEDGRREVCNQGTTSSSSSSSSARNRLSGNTEIYWQDVKTTFNESDVKGMTRLQRITATSSISYKDAIQQLKKKAAAIGGTMVLIMDVPENSGSDRIEIMGIAYRDETMEYTPRTSSERTNVPQESSSNTRRRRILQQMEGYNNDSKLELEDTRPSSSRTSTSRPSSSGTTSRQTSNDTPDALYLTNGRVIRGTIEELEPDDFVSIRTVAGKVYEFSMDDVKRISRTSSGKTSSRTTASSRDSRVSSGSEDDYYDDYYSNPFGYKGTFDVGYDLPIGGVAEKGAFEINTSHGLQLNDYLFVGIGVGLHIYNARDPLLKPIVTAGVNTNKSYPQYAPNYNTTKLDDISKNTTIDDSVVYLHAVDSMFMTLPIFLDVRGYLPMANLAVKPFVMLRAGYSFNLSDAFGGMGWFINPAIGVQYQISPKIGVNLTLGYAYQSYGGTPKDGGYGYYYFKDATKNTKGYLSPFEATGAGSLSLKVGVEF